MKAGRKRRRRRDSAATRQALFAAGATAFAARGFDGAGVDEIAAAAGVNKAMLYYHFKSKRGLYTAVLADMFSAVADRVAPLATAPGDPAASLEAFVDALADACRERPHFPAIWLRELADEGRHLDASVVPIVRGILDTLAGLLARGRREGRFREVHPLLVQFGIIGPLLVYLGSAPARRRLLADAPQLAAIDDEMAFAHVKVATLATVLADPAGDTQ